MKLAVKILSVAVLIALASPLILLKGCGNILTGGACGGCPDSTAPFGSTIVAPELSSATVNPNFNWCYPDITFKFWDLMASL